ncbi:hypothetical protein POM88_047175 [Heracleum sosnowskyi]|uniref:Uncharacterized protein n=1 Tax=Heracleum sosnowskyi TaxID=360622 RepID=A0AAD8M6R6_9APIA|nr:hypothetical protein POM88_047175 [Heracleum sosnowskyi]
MNFFNRFPYFLPCLAISLFALVVDVACLWLPEFIVTRLFILQNRAVDQDQRGAANGIAMALMSLSKAVGPAIGGALCYSPFNGYKIHPFQGGIRLRYEESKQILGKDKCNKLKILVRHEKFDYYSPLNESSRRVAPATYVEPSDIPIKKKFYWTDSKLRLLVTSYHSYLEKINNVKAVSCFLSFPSYLCTYHNVASIHLDYKAARICSTFN